MLELSRTTRVACSRDALWNALSDPERIVDALPNVDEVRWRSDESFAARVAPTTALGPTRLEMLFTIVDRDEGEAVTLMAQGCRSEQAVEVRARFRFRDVEDGCAVIDWQASVGFFGPLRAVGQRVLPTLAEREIERVLLRAAEVARRQ